MAELPTQRDFEDFSAWTGRDVVGADGDRLGAVELIFLDEATDLPEWVLVRLDGDDAAAFVPLAGATVEERSIRVEQARDRVTAAPRLDVEETLTVAEERRLYEHYGLAYSQQESSTVLPEGAAADPSAQPTEERPRLRKYVGAPVPPSPSPDTSPEAAGPPPDASPSAPAPTASATPEATEPTPRPDAASAPETRGTGPTGPDAAASAPPTPLPPPAPTPIPPEGGFQREPGEVPSGGGGPLAALKRRPAIPVALAGAIAGLVAVLLVRRRR